MLWSHPDHPDHRVRLGYCLNLSAALDLEGLLESLRSMILPLRDRLAPEGTFGVGMYVPALLAGHLVGEEGAEDSNDTDDNASALPPPVAGPVKAPVVDKWVEWKANPKPYGGMGTLAKIREAKESGATRLVLPLHRITDLTPLAELTNLTGLNLGTNINIIDLIR